MNHASFSEKNFIRLCDFLRKNSENGGEDNIFIVTMNIESIDFRLELKPVLPNHISITGASERRSPDDSAFIPVLSDSVLYSLMNLYLFKNLCSLEEKDDIIFDSK